MDERASGHPRKSLLSLRVRLGAALAIAAVLLSVRAGAETINLKGGTIIQGTVTKTDADSVEVQIKKSLIDPDDYAVSSDTSSSAHAGIIVLKDGSNLRGTVTASDADTVTVRIMRRQISDIVGAAAQSAPTSAGRKEPPPEASAEPRRRDYDWPARGPRNEFHVNVGGFLPLTKLSIQGTDNLAGTGYALGAQYFRQLGSRISPGLEIEKLTAGQHDSPTLITDGNTNSQFDSLTMMALLRFSPGEGDTRRYAIIGFGFHSTNIQINSTPQTGYVWTDTHTTETRTVVNATKSAPAFTLQAGANFMITDSISYGAGFAYYYLATATYPAAPSAQVFGLAGIKQPIAGIDLTANLNVHF